MIATLAISFALAFLAESLVEYLFGTLVDHVPQFTPWKWLLQYIAAGVGVAFTFYYKIDLIAELGNAAGGVIQASWLGFLLSGLVIGRGANFLHQFVSQYFPKQ